MIDLEIIKVKESKISKYDLENLVFGTIFTDHMLIMEYKNEKWQKPKIVPYGPISIEPSMCSLHYAQMGFEGLKAFKTVNNKINIFRMDRNCKRFEKTCERLCIPPIPEDVFMEGTKTLVSLDREWIPKKKGSALYIRPFAFAKEPFLGVRPAKSYYYMVILSPVGPYYKEGFSPVKLTTSGKFSRTCEGGLGFTKAAANYAISLYPATEAQKRGYTQVLWLDGKEHKYVEEVGTMNFFCVIDNEVLTPPTDTGTILPGITRESVITILKDKGYKVTERKVSIDEIFEAYDKGKLNEVFGTGTAAVISPVGELEHEGRKILINNGETGPFAKMLFYEITGIQYGEKPDKYGWNFIID
jgi:branched-chain amino acid aminotransferase